MYVLRWYLDPLGVLKGCLYHGFGAYVCTIVVCGPIRESVGGTLQT